MRTILVVVLCLAVACGASVSQRTSAGGHALATCAKVDVSQAVGSDGLTFAAVASKVEQIVIAGLANWEAELTTIAADVGEAAFQCILDFVEAFLSPPTAAAGSGSGVAPPSTAAPDPALLRLRSYRAKLKASAIRAEIRMFEDVGDQALAAVGATR